MQLHQVLSAGLQQEAKLKQVYTDIEMPLVDVLLDVEQNGVLIDREMLQKQGREIDQKLSQIEQTIYQQAGEVFNLSSPKQIQAILFDKLAQNTERAAVNCRRCA
jgi:DNA polymerase-1